MAPINIDVEAPRFGWQITSTQRNQGQTAYQVVVATTQAGLSSGRGGGWTGGNLVAACGSCNNRKADRTPQEAGMRLLWDPSLAATEYAGVQAEVWRILEEGIAP